MNLPGEIKGRGSRSNPTNRFTTLEVGFDPEFMDGNEQFEDYGSPNTTFLKDSSATIISTNSSPDVGFDASINPYRGCEHGCSYCYARPTHEYFGFSTGLDFETKILVKENAATLLKKELSKKSWAPQVVALSGVTDAYQPVERRLRITRSCIEVLSDHMNPLTIITKNALVTRDIDLLIPMAQQNACKIAISVTTLDEKLSGDLEPRASRPTARLEAIKRISDAGIPCGVLIAPVIPGLTEFEIPNILQGAADAGAQFAGYTVLRLPLGVGPIFDEWLINHRPGYREKIMNRLKSLRNGKVNSSKFGERMKSKGNFADEIRFLFQTGLKKSKLSHAWPKLSTEHFKREPNQLELF